MAEITELGTYVTEAVTAVTELDVIELADQGPPGPPGDDWLPDPTTLANGRYITTFDGQYIDVPAPSGAGDMQSLIYDPQGRSTNAFLLDNQSGILDAGVFT